MSQIASLLLIVLVLGAGTDYALFLMFRVREEMRAGLASGDRPPPRAQGQPAAAGGKASRVAPPMQRCHEAIVLSVARVGETITFSAGVLIAALLSLATATFSLYSGLAAPLAIAIGLMLIAGLTLLPALLAICGPVAFWPSSVKPGAGSPVGPDGGGRPAPGSSAGRWRRWSSASSSSARSRWPRPATWPRGSAAR